MLNDRVIRATFIISILGHSVFLGVFKINIEHSQLDKPKEVTVSVEIEKELLLPKIDIMGEEKKIKDTPESYEQPELKQEIQSEDGIIEEVSEETVQEKIDVSGLNQEAMLRYQDMVKRRIEDVRKYPVWAKKQGIEGIVFIKFFVLSDGLTRGITIVKSSDSKLLDDEAVETIKRANPFPPIPEEINSKQVQMEAAIVFSLR